MADYRPDERTPLISNQSSSVLQTADDAEDCNRDEGLPRVNSHPSDYGTGLSPGAQSFPALAEEEEDTRSKSPYLNGVSVTRFWLIYGGVLLQYFVASFDSTIMASSHPVITSYFHSSNSASWLSTVFMLTSTAFQPLLARVSDTIGRRPVYLFSLVMFMVTTAWCGLAQSIGSFIAARAFCGLGAGGVLSMGSILSNDLVPLEIRGTYQAYINLFYGCGLACGAAFGGYLCDTLGWRWMFGVQIPSQILILVAACFTMPSSLGPHLAKHSNKTVGQHIKSFDLAGSFLLTTTVASMILGLNLGGNVLAWLHPFVIISLVVSCIAGTMLIWVESKAERPVLPLSMLFTSPRGNLVFSNFFSNIGSNTIIFNAPLFFQAVKLDSPSQSGLRLTAPMIATMLTGVGSGFIMTWTGRTKPLIICGTLLTLSGTIALSCMWDGIPVWLATVFAVPVNGGLGFSFPASTLTVIAASTKVDQAVMSSTLSLARSLGSVFGVAISSLIVQNALSVDLERLVTGPNKDEIIQRVRKSVRAIFELTPKHQTEVIHAYEHSLRFAFLSAVAALVVATVLVLRIRTPRLNKGKN
ncbi:uncharacterized protein K452DRAFT_285828 [Aplosporella prunicola CBS 121167]|uniref:Major facilitator superfamily (MFS) profile domain-containing protein n=1 Tax=Aplosporella prunicola CBS 121167 TaxID=1176127 RepID=A0A6A6BI33_9PEZI|nr:uncharacterized protein K452DRAFT_285828 [Aplosporella prunicola CBS 121167]KAF2143790.1 hypothetical protein K452DRAFT_285828 [Aplosporella prunicola CBS 121167]